MIEAYIRSTETVKLFVYENGVRVSPDAAPTFTWEAIDDSTVSGTYASGDISAVAVTGASPSYTYYKASFPPPGYDDICRTFKLTWDFDYTPTGGGSTVQMTRNDFVNVVQPLVTVDEIRQEYPQFDVGGAEEKTYDELKAMERKVRNVIETYCNQSFGFKGNKTMSVISDGNDYLQLPDRAVRLEEVKYKDTVYFNRWTAADTIPSGSSVGDVRTEIVTFNKDFPWTVQRKFFRGIPWDVKQAVDETLLSRRHIFKTQYIYDVNADWGWEYVPGEVNLAALLLVGNYFCKDNTYHVRGISVVRSADWRMEFAHDPYSTTGNVMADQLLSQYINPAPVVI